MKVNRCAGAVLTVCAVAGLTAPAQQSGSAVYGQGSIAWEADLAADAQAYEAQKWGADGIIVVLKDDAFVTDSKGKSALDKTVFKNLETPKPLIPNIGKKARASGKKTTSRAERRLGNMHKVQLAQGADMAAALKELKASPLVEYASPNYKMQPFSAAPNDPMFWDLFALNNSGQTLKIMGPNRTLVNSNGLADADMDWLEVYTNSAVFPTNEIIVAVIDTGVDYNHPELVNQMWHNPGEWGGIAGADDDGNGWTDDVYGVDFYNEDADPADKWNEGGGHGTHVAGTIAAQGNNNYGIIGVNPNARIMACKFLDAGGGYGADAIRAIYYAVDKGAKVLNNSWGGGAYDQAMQDAIEYAVENGAVFVAAAGNDDSSAATYPACYNYVVAVASLDEKDQKSYFSNYGSWVDVASHGSSILSLRAAGCWSNYTGLIISNDLLVIQGTSMACPNGAGAMSLLVSKFPGHDSRIYERVLESTCDTNMLGIGTNAAYSGKLGAGRVNAQRLLTEPVDTGFVHARWADTPLIAVPGFSNTLNFTVGIWSNAATALTIKITNITSGISVSTNRLNIGALAAYTVTNLPTNLVWGTISTNSTNNTEQLLVTMMSGNTTMDVRTVSLSLVNGSANHLLVDDFDGDGTNEVAANYYEYVMMYNNRGTLKWIQEAVIIESHWNYGMASGDIDGNGVKNLVTDEGRWFFSYGPGALWAFEPDGMRVPNFPIVGTNYDDYRGMGEPTLVDVNMDGDYEMVCNMEGDDFDLDTNPTFVNNRGFVNCYDGDGTMLWQTQLPLRFVGPIASGDLDGDGVEELVTWNNYSTYFLPFNGSICILNADDGSMKRQIPFDYWGQQQHEQMGIDLSKCFLGDLDGDGDLEIIVKAFHRGFYGYQESATNSSVAIFAWHHDGTLVTGFPHYLLTEGANRTYGEPQIADINGDGKVEVLLVSTDESGDGTVVYNQKLHAMGTNGYLSGNPVTFSNNFEYGENFSLDDMNGDAISDWVFTQPSSTSLYIRAFNATGGQVYASAKIGKPAGGSSFFGGRDLITDNLQFNTNRHVVMSFRDKLIVYDTGNGFRKASQNWPMARHDQRRTGRCSVEPTSTVYKCSFTGSPLNGISNLTTVFQASLVNFDATNSWYAWDFNNDGTADYSVFGQRGATNSYSAIGDYSVRLTVSNAAGKVFTRTRTNYVHVLAPVIADFEAALYTAEVPVKIRFTDTSLNQPQSWQWDVNDNGSVDSTNRNPEILFDSTGVYTVRLTVANNFGAWGSSTSTTTKVISLTNTASTTTKYVSTNGLSLYPYKNWNEAATNLQAALNAANNSDTVLVSNGVYSIESSGWINPDYLYLVDYEFRMEWLNNVTLMSVNGPEFTVLSGHPYYVQDRVLTLNDSDNITIDGFTVRSGFNMNGAGIYVDEYSTGAQIKNCLFKHNESGTEVNSGSGLFAHNNVTVSNCVFRENTGRSCALWIKTMSVSQTALVENCTFANNGKSDRYEYNAVIGVSSRPWFPDPGPIGTTLLRNCLITGNRSSESLIYSQAPLIIENCTIADNIFYPIDGAAGVESVFRSHAADSSFELASTNAGPWTVRNTVVARNDMGIAGVLAWAQTNSPINFSYCSLPAATTGAGNLINSDDLLSAIPGDIHLDPRSAAINAGTSLIWHASSSDYPDGDPRVISNRVDMGADEFAEGCYITASPMGGITPLNVDFSGTYVSWNGRTATNWIWDFGDGAQTGGTTLSNVSHIFNSESNFLVILTVQTDGGAVSNGIIIDADNTGPHFVSAYATNESLVYLIFDEALNPVSVSNAAYYTVNALTVSTPVLTASNIVRLTVMPELTSGGSNTVTAQSVQDAYGNAMSGVETQKFVWVRPEGVTWYFDLGSDYDNGLTTNANWNNLYYVNPGGTLVVVSNAVNGLGETTPVNFRPLSNFSPQFADTNVLGRIYPFSAMKDFIYSSAVTGAWLRLENLPATNAYDLSFFASANPLTTGEFAGDYMADGKSVYLNAESNSSTTVTLYDVRPDTNGNLDICLRSPDGIRYAAIGVLEVRLKNTKLESSTSRLDVAEGGTTNFQIRMTKAPIEDLVVTISRASGDADISAVTTSLTFTASNWSEWQTVTLTAAEDADATNGVAVIQVVANASITMNITVKEIENDSKLISSQSTLVVPEGGSNAFTVALTAPPPTGSATVTVSRASGDTDLNPELNELVFNSVNWNVPQSVRVQAVYDSDSAIGSAVIRCAADTLSSTVSVTAVEQDITYAAYGAAYHDMDPVSGDGADHPNVSHGNTLGAVYSLKELSTGNTLPFRIRFMTYDPWGENADYGTPGKRNHNPAAGTPAYNLFNGKIDTTNAYFLTQATLAGGYGMVYFTNLTKGVRYTVSLYTCDSNQNRTTKYTLQNASGFTNISSAGTGDAGDSDPATATVSANNTANGYLVAWSNIVPMADDGSVFAVRVDVFGSDYAYFPQAIMLKELDGTGEGAIVIQTSTGAVNVAEGGTATFNVRLAGTPASPVTVTVARVSGDTDISVQSGASLVFSSGNWSNWQTVTLAAAEDGDWLDGTAVIRCSSPVLVQAEVTATEADNEYNPDTALPFSETFDGTGMAANIGILDGQHGWTSGTNALVQTNAAHGGTKALSVVNDTAAHPFANGTDHVRFSWRLRPVPGIAPTSGLSGASAVLWVNTNGNVAVYSNSTAVVLPVTVSSNVWNLFEAEVSYASNVWKLSVNGTNVAENLGFYSARSAFAELVLAGSMYFDDLNISNLTAQSFGL